RYPLVFSRCAALSPSIWWENTWILSDLAARLESLKQTRFWVDIGTREGDNPQAHLNNLRRVAELLRQAGLKEKTDFMAREIEGATHSEQAWSARFDQVLLFLYPMRKR
ncbi:MAG TPA: alpha/beta hydrolase-fold protein, partial [Candidatus Ozemobacteraceae bacterium]|nr:alpha/beta hydrolase-fold protein [Candidatus Ozemobacteraceae bacterium]